MRKYTNATIEFTYHPQLHHHPRAWVLLDSTGSQLGRLQWSSLMYVMPERACHPACVWASNTCCLKAAGTRKVWKRVQNIWDYQWEILGTLNWPSPPGSLWPLVICQIQEGRRFVHVTRGTSRTWSPQQDYSCNAKEGGRIADVILHRTDHWPSEHTNWSKRTLLHIHLRKYSS